MAKHLPCVVWNTRIGADDAYQTVRTKDNSHITIGLFPGNRCDGIGFTLSRLDARLLAKRINQCLDETAIK